MLIFNVSEVEPRPPGRNMAERVTVCLALSLIMLTAFIGNTAVITVCSLQRKLRQDVSNLLVINLCITDLGNTIVMMTSLIAMGMDVWSLGDFWCNSVCAINYCLIIVSMLTLCCVSVERYQAVVHPLTYHYRVTRKRLLVLMVYTWLQGLVFGLAPAIMKWISYDYWEGVCAIQWHLHRPATVIYVILAFLFCFLGPGILLVWCYKKILEEVRKQSLEAPMHPCTNDKTVEKQKRSRSDKTKLIWSLMTVVVAYFICTAPFSVTKLIKVSADVESVPGWLNLVASLLGYIASAINPFIYGIFRRDFRKAYFQLLKTVINCESFTHSESSSDSPHYRVSAIPTKGSMVSVRKIDHYDLECNTKSNEQSNNIAVQSQEINTNLMTRKESPNNEIENFHMMNNILDSPPNKACGSNSEHTIEIKMKPGSCSGLSCLTTSQC
ncbi:hypothetical protein DPMN_097324 [Dreissena polymorpha]|uniref:G-protein coupled receptors family 1 profile domain-containing protein n=1 Tax=Dreissena polymorpha TaxID=45954 RepID=A0A9D4R6A2_DREPO|nr:hypothetical protein DPMN_097324 [Dreissena polymorpha]